MVAVDVERKVQVDSWSVDLPNVAVDANLRLSALERRVLESVSRRGLGRFVLIVAVASVVLSEVVTIVLLTAVDTPPTEKWVGLGIAFAVPSVVAPLMAWVIGRLLDDLGRATAALQDLADTDPLTGVCNRRAFAERAAALWTTRADAIVTVVMVDVDHFKTVNDRFGHATGDRVLVALANALAVAATTGADEAVVGRLGGDEFAVVALVADTPSATALASAVRAACDLGDIAPGVTATAGIATTTTLDRSDPATTLDAALARADQALYATKGPDDRVRWRSDRLEMSAGSTTAAR